MSKVLIISASDSSVPTMKAVQDVLDEFGVSYTHTISSAHSSPDRTLKLIKDFHENEGKVIICGAGLAAHLAGVVAAHFPLPVIGVPLGDGSLKGLDALLATLQMPSGIPVATVGIDMAKNAGILAVQILATSDSELENKLVEYKKKLAEGVEEKAANLKSNGSD